MGGGLWLALPEQVWGAVGIQSHFQSNLNQSKRIPLISKAQVFRTDKHSVYDTTQALARHE